MLSENCSKFLDLEKLSLIWKNFLRTNCAKQLCPIFAVPAASCASNFVGFVNPNVKSIVEFIYSRTSGFLCYHKHKIKEVMTQPPKQIAVSSSSSTRHKARDSASSKTFAEPPLIKAPWDITVHQHHEMVGLMLDTPI